jgi:ubiquinone/menaquinone biosynthesis C-methylase UbiE
MTLQDTYQTERTKWDAFALQQLKGSILLSPGDNFYRYAQRTSTMVGVNDFLGDLSGKRVLEYGCGLGEISTLLAASGAQITSFDLSEISVAVAKKRAELNNLETKVNLSVAGGETLPFADESFDVVFGKAILHHLDVTLGWHDLYRVLKTGGKAAFVEPLGMNPFLNFVRDHVPYRHKNLRGADRPLTYHEVHRWGANFHEYHYREIQLLSMLERGLGFNKRLAALRRLDDVLLKHLPFLRRYCRYIVMLMVK